MNDEVKQAKEIEATEAAQANAQQRGPVTEENTSAVPADAASQGQAGESAAAGDLNPEFEALVQALEAGEDINEQLEATAAGEGGGGAGDSIGTGARLDRIDSQANPNAGIDPDIPPTPLIDPTADTEIIADLGSPAPEDDFIEVIPDDGVIVESGGSFGGSVIENDNFGPDGAGSPPVVAVNGSAANIGQPIAGSLGGTLIINADGTYDYTPPPQVDHSDDIADTETFTYTIQDSTGDTATATVVFTIVDTVPIAVDDTNSVTEDSQVSIIDGDVLANDISDADVPLSFISWGPETAQYGDITLNPDGTYSYSLTNGHPAVDALDDGETLTETFTYTMSDSDGSQDTATLTITIHGTNDAPVAVADTNWAQEDVS
ncbi:MAG: VCBS domain-containing protein, partial [Porticoccaceae bacterium]